MFSKEIGYFSRDNKAPYDCTALLYSNTMEE